MPRNVNGIVDFNKLQPNNWKTPVVATLGALGGAALVAGTIFAISYSGHGIRSLHGSLAGRVSLITSFASGGALLFATTIIGIKIKEIKIGRKDSCPEVIPLNDEEKSADALGGVRIEVTSSDFLSGTAKHRLDRCIWCEEELKQVNDSDDKNQMLDYVAYLKKKAEDDIEEIQRFLAEKNVRKDVEYRQVRPKFGPHYEAAAEVAERIKKQTKNNLTLLCNYVSQFQGRISENLTKLIVENDLDYHIAMEITKISEQENIDITNENLLIEAIKKKNPNFVIYTVSAEVPKRDESGDILFRSLVDQRKPTVDHKNRGIPNVQPYQSSYWPVMVAANSYLRRVFINGVEQAGKNPEPGSYIVLRIAEKVCAILPPDYSPAQTEQPAQVLQND